MNADELHEEWTQGESSGMRPRRIQQVRDDIEDITGLAVPRRIPEIEGWLERMKGQVTRKLKKAKNDGDES